MIIFAKHFLYRLVNDSGSEITLQNLLDAIHNIKIMSYAMNILFTLVLIIFLYSLTQRDTNKSRLYSDEHTNTLHSSNSRTLYSNTLALPSDGQEGGGGTSP